MGTSSSVAPLPEAVNVSLNGKAHGGQLPLVGSTVAVYAYGNTGYGSTGSFLGSTTTNAQGNFNVNYTCPSATTPVYALVIGGNAQVGAGVNSAILEGAALGPCGTAEVAPFIVINEVSTAVLAYSFAQFFSSTTSDSYTHDHFGAPNSLTAAVTRVNNVLVPALIDIPSANPKPSTSTFVNETAKIVSLGNLLAVCVNSSGPTSSACKQLFNPSGGATSSSTPTNTLEAAVNVALNPNTGVSTLYNLATYSSTAPGSTYSPPFSGGLTMVPNDWTLAVGYIAPTLGFGLNTRYTATLDIDAQGRVWFPVNGSGGIGVVSFDPGSLTFSPVYTATGLTRPQNLAIDGNGVVWVTDASSASVYGFPVANPSQPVVLTQSGTTSTGVTVLSNGTVAVGALNGNSDPGLEEITYNGTGYSYKYNFIGFSNFNGYLAANLAGDTQGGIQASVNAVNTNQSYGYYVSSNFGLTNTSSQTNDAEQNVFVGGGFATARGGYNTVGDGICFYTFSNQSANTTPSGCYSMQNQNYLTATQQANSFPRHPMGMALDGNGSLWLADNAVPSIEEVAPTVNATTSAFTYLDSNNVPNNLADLHDTNNGGTMLNPAGIGVDNTGNVWVTNFGCYTTNCTPANNFLLTEVIGAGGPTVTPISAQVSANPTVKPSARTAGSSTTSIFSSRPR